MMNAPLFESQTIPLHEAVALMERQLEKKCSTWHISFGVFKGKTGPEDHNAMVVITDKSGKHHNTTLPARSMSDMLHQVNTMLSSINP